MSCFDSVTVPCPRCGEVLEFQSKAGECQLVSYRLNEDQIPPRIITDLAGSAETCSCGAKVSLYLTHPPRMKGVLSNDHT